MASLVLLNNVTIPPGTQLVGPVSVPDNITSCKITVDRTNWTDPGVTLSVVIDLSIDGGVTWASTTPSNATNPFPIGVEAVGGVLLDKHGAVIPVTTISANFPSVTNRRVKVTVTVAGGSLTTTVTLVTS